MTRIRKGVITAAGRGTRLMPATRTVQKELFPLVDVDGLAKPIIQILVEELLASGVDEICIVANPINLEPMERHFAGETDGARVTFVVQERQEGYGHAVYQTKNWVGDEPFVLTLGDHIYFSEIAARCARQVMEAFEGNDCSVSSVFPVAEAEVTRYGIIAGIPLNGSLPAVYEIRAMAEKPSIEFARENLTTPGLPDGKFLTFFGIHTFTATIFDCLEHLINNDLRQNGEIQLTTAQEILLAREKYLASEVQGVRYDMGIPAGLIETQIALALRSPHAQIAREMLSLR